MEIIFLGTSSMVPTKDRNHSAFLLIGSTETILFDCGEGTQKQLKIAEADINRITKILISHWHGDHVLGLPGLIQTMASQQYKGNLQVYGPKGSKAYAEAMFNGFAFDKSRLNYEIIEIEKDGVIFNNKDFSIEARKLDHSVPCYGFAYIQEDKRKIKLDAAKKLGISEGPLLGKLQAGETVTVKGKKIHPDDVSTIIKGKKIAYVADTMPCDGAVELAKDSDLLISEATMATKIEGKAEEYKHMTAKQAGMLANQANVKKLIITHFSQRYKSSAELEEEAKDVFYNVVAAYDFMKIKV